MCRNCRRLGGLYRSLSLNGVDRSFLCRNHMCRSSLRWIDLDWNSLCRNHLRRNHLCRNSLNGCNLRLNNRCWRCLHRCRLCSSNRSGSRIGGRQEFPRGSKGIGTGIGMCLSQFRGIHRDTGGGIAQRVAVLAFRTLSSKIGALLKQHRIGKELFAYGHQRRIRQGAQSLSRHVLLALHSSGIVHFGGELTIADEISRVFEGIHSARLIDIRTLSTACAGTTHNLQHDHHEQCHKHYREHCPGCTFSNGLFESHAAQQRINLIGTASDSADHHRGVFHRHIHDDSASRVFGDCSGARTLL